MASGYKSHKTELVAIYKLEFYKKQKNWKFANELKKPVKTPRSRYTKIRKSLNETYDVEPETTSEASPLNDGFLDDIPDKDPGCPQQTPAPANTLCDEGCRRPWSPGFEHSEPERDDQQEWDMDQEVLMEPAWLDPVTPQDYGEVVWTGEGVASPYDCVDAPRGWSQDIQLEELVTAIERCGTAADGSGTCIGQPEASVDRDLSSDSFVEFIRGAHLAPHSSEVDLQLDTCGGRCARSPASLPTRALAAGVRAHAAALAALLRETARRDAAKFSRTCCSEQLLPPFPEQQWQETHPLTRQDTFTVSCSNIGNLGAVGRGRGRLHRDRIIGIGMGRPYRLT